MCRYFIKENENNYSTSEAAAGLVTLNTRSESGRLMFELGEVRNSTLEFIYASNEYNGEYYCKVSKNGVSAESKRALYKYGGVDNFSVFVVEPAFTTPTQSSDARLTCQTKETLSSTPTLHWFYNPDNKTKFNISNNEFGKYNLDMFDIKVEGNRSVLEFVYGSVDYDGEYYCIAMVDTQMFVSRPAPYRYAGYFSFENSTFCKLIAQYYVQLSTFWHVKF